MTTHAVIFAPIGQESRSDQIIRRLSNAIVSGLLGVDEQLPNEAELARMLGVSHITVREALNTLRSQGLLYTVRGRNGGSFVADFKEGPKQKIHSFDHLSGAYLSDLGEWHSAIFIHAVGLAATRMAARDHATLEDYIDTLAEANSAEGRCQADMRCLLTLAANSQSARIANQELVVQSEWASLVTLLYRSDKLHSEVVAIYRQLASACRQKDKSQAIELAGNLINYFTEKLIEYKFSNG